MRARLVDKEVPVDVTVEIEGALDEDAKALVERIVAEVKRSEPQFDMGAVIWDEHEITRDWTRNGKRRIRVDFKDRNTMPLFVTITQDETLLTFEQIEFADNVYARIRTADGRFVAVWFQGTAEEVEELPSKPITEAEVRDLISDLQFRHRFDELLKHPVIDPEMARIDR